MLINLRTAYGEELLALAKENSRVVALDADLCGSTQSVVIEKNFPERYFEMGIGEQNMISVAAGLSLTGKIPFAHSFAVFASGRPFDQIRQSVCLPKLNVKIVGSSCGLSDFGDGATHQSFEDLATMRVLPGMTVFCPADAVETKWAVRQAAAIDGPVYIRLNRNDLPVLFDEKTPFETGKPLVVKEGSQVALVATGTMTAIAMEAAGLLETAGNLRPRRPSRDDQAPLREVAPGSSRKRPGDRQLRGAHNLRRIGVGGRGGPLRGAPADEDGGHPGPVRPVGSLLRGAA